MGYYRLENAPISYEEIMARGFMEGTLDKFLSNLEERIGEEIKGLQCARRLLTKESMDTDDVIRGAKYIAAHPEIVKAAEAETDVADAVREGKA